MYPGEPPPLFLAWLGPDALPLHLQAPFVPAPHSVLMALPSPWANPAPHGPSACSSSLSNNSIFHVARRGFPSAELTWVPELCGGKVPSNNVETLAKEWEETEQLPAMPFFYLLSKQLREEALHTPPVVFRA